MKKKILAIIPARGGSKGLKNKNLKKIGKNSLISLAIKSCKKLKSINKIFVSTDSKKIVREAEKQGIKVPFLRSKKISGDKVPAIDVLYQTLNLVEKFYKEKFATIIYLEPTSPLRKTQDILLALKKFKKNNYDSLWTISKIDLKFHPLKQVIVNKNTVSSYEKKGEKIYARQQLSQTYYRNGVCYIFKRKTILLDKKIMGKKCGYHITSSPQVSIDNYKDLIYARKIKKFR